MKKDKIFTALYLILCTAISIFIYLFPQSSENAEVHIYRKGEKVISFSLDKDSEYTFEDIKYTVASENGKVFVKETQCSGKQCMHMGKISRVGSSILCIPNEITVMIEAGKNDSLDGVAG